MNVLGIESAALFQSRRGLVAGAWGITAFVLAGLSLAGMATARVRANDSQERVFCDRALHGDSLRVALHLNQPAHASRLFPQVVDPRTALTQFRRELRAVDPHAICCGKGVARPALPWHVA